MVARVDRALKDDLDIPDGLASMIRCAFLSSFSSRAFRRSSLRTFSSSGFRSGLRPRFFDRAFSDPLCAALAENVYVLDPCCGTGSYLAEVLRRIALRDR